MEETDSEIYLLKLEETYFGAFDPQRKTRTQNLSQTGPSVLLENINSLERAQEFAARINDKTVGRTQWP